MVKLAFQTAASTRNPLRIPAPGRRLRRAREKRARAVAAPITLPHAEPYEPVTPVPNPVRIAVLAMEGLGRASMRASFTGTEVQVTVPDAGTAAVFEAAILETANRRPTDRLIRIVIA
jgi:hypothetical protein